MEGRDDLTVALVAVGCTVGFTVLTAYGLGVDTGAVLRMVPLAPYLAYLFTRQADLPAALDTPRNWSLLTVAVTLCLLGYVVLV